MIRFLRLFERDLVAAIRAHAGMGGAVTRAVDVPCEHAAVRVGAGRERRDSPRPPCTLGAGRPEPRVVSQLQLRRRLSMSVLMTSPASGRPVPLVSLHVTWVVPCPLTNSPVGWPSAV